MGGAGRSVQISSSGLLLTGTISVAENRASPSVLISQGS